MNSGKLCISVAFETIDEVIEGIERAEEFADVIEVRFDCLQKAELEVFHSRPGSSKRLFNSTTLPIISTYRPKDQGGFRDLTVEERDIFWNGGFETEYCDVEEEFVENSCYWLWTYRICSYHDFSGVPSDIDDIFWRLAGTEADKIKIAAQADDIVDAIPVWKLLDHLRPYGDLSPRRVIPIAMGEAGKWTRILGLAHGAYLTYASLDAGSETADGQITAKDMLEVYRVKDLDLETKVYGIIGDPVSSSMSPYFQNAAFRSAGINSVFIPLLVKDLESFIRRMVKPETREVELNFAGFSVTMPHKLAIVDHLDEIDDVAKRIGAVNTVVIHDGRLIGHNTDAHGFITPLKREFGDLKDARVAIIGAGGAARACCYALNEAGADVTVFARDAKKAETLHSEFGVEVAEFNGDDPPPMSAYDVVVNATPTGMKGPLANETLLNAEQLSGVRFVFDLVTPADDTPLIGAARKAGIPAIGGAEMLIAQGMRQFELWTGIDAPAEVMRDALDIRLSENK